MPKSIIREFDNSTTGIALSSEFAVVVPGYAKYAETDASIEKAKKAGLYIAPSVYEFKTQKQFVEYIGKFPGRAEAAVAPTLVVLNSEETGIDKYRRKITLSDFDDPNYVIYVGEELSASNPKYEHDGYLLKTFSVEEQELTPAQEESANPRTFIFTAVAKASDVRWDGNYTSEDVYFKIRVGNEGADLVVDPHMGNQIAYELLGLGYTVIYKLLDKGTSAYAQLRSPEFWEEFKDKSVYHYRYLMSGCYDAATMKTMSDVAKFNNNISIETAETYGNPAGRGDVIALCDVDESLISDKSTMEGLLTGMHTAIGAMDVSHKYAAIFAPRVVYSMTGDPEYEYNVTFPCSFHYLACAAYSQERYAEWYAVAGYTRGISSKAIAYPTLTFGEIAINTLAPRVINTFADVAVNLILSERGNYYLWGNRTAEPLNTDGLKFSHFLNIRQLCTTLKKTVYQASRKFTFDPNSDLLWINFVNAIRPELEGMKADQGIKAYKITRVVTDKKALLVAKIRIVPIEALEDFDISIYLEDSLSGIIINADEEEAA